jgi:uncharacterized DUF497 family protein
LATFGQSRNRAAARRSLLLAFMALRVEWKETVTRSLGEHGVRLEEAATVLGDPLSRTIADPTAPAFDRSSFVTMGLSNQARMLVVSHVDHGQIVRIISARRASQKTSARRGIRMDYDFRNGVRGKYASRYWEAAARGGALCKVSRK